MTDSQCVDYLENIYAIAKLQSQEVKNDGDLIRRDALKEVIKANHYLLSAKNNSTDYGMFTTGIMQAIDNAPTIAVNCKDCDGYEAGYSAGMRDTERTKGDIFPMEIVAGKCPIEVGGNCPLKSQGEWIKWSFKTFGAMGDWEYKCSNCGKVYGGEYNFCPNCGAEMRKSGQEVSNDN